MFIFILTEWVSARHIVYTAYSVFQDDPTENLKFDSRPGSG